MKNIAGGCTCTREKKNVVLLQNIIKTLLATVFYVSFLRLADLKLYQTGQI